MRWSRRISDETSVGRAVGLYPCGVSISAKVDASEAGRSNFAPAFHVRSPPVEPPIPARNAEARKSAARCHNVNTPVAGEHKIGYLADDAAAER